LIFFCFEFTVLVYLNAASKLREKVIVPVIGLEFSAPALAKGSLSQALACDAMGNGGGVKSDRQADRSNTTLQSEEKMQE